MRCFRDVLRKTLPPDFFGDVLEKVKHLSNDAPNDVSRPALGPGAAAAAGRRWQAAELERCWRREERAHSLATSQGWRAYRTGFGKLD